MNPYPRHYTGNTTLTQHTGQNSQVTGSLKETYVFFFKTKLIFFTFLYLPHEHILTIIKQTIHINKPIFRRLVGNFSGTDTIQSQIPSKTLCGKRQHNIIQHQRHHQLQPCKQPLYLYVFIRINPTSQLRYQPNQIIQNHRTDRQTASNEVTTNLSQTSLLFLFWSIIHLVVRGGWSGGAMVQGKHPVSGRPTNLYNSRARAYYACGGAGWGLFAHNFFRLSFL